VQWATSHSAERPANYGEIVEANRGRALTPLELVRPLELGPNRCSVSR
jgi:hypothetical protein